eukprot:125196_1
MSSTRRKQQKLEIGDCVETSKGEKCVIRFIGKVKRLSHDTLYGIEYIDGTMGDHNGTYRGKKYFIGEHKRCSFIKYDKIRRKTKHYSANTHSARHKSGKTHSKDMFSTGYRYTFPVNYSSLAQSKRKSLPAKLNKSNKRKKAHTAQTMKRLNLSRRASDNKKHKKHLPKLDKIAATSKKRRNTKQLGECSLYPQEKIHFSAMNALELSDCLCTKNRKNAFGHIVLSADSLTTYHISHNVLVGEIKIGHRYLLKDGHYGVCLFVGHVHWINYEQNEYIGIALEEAHGKHDGEWKGKRYFQCQPRCGVFVTRNKLYRDCGRVDDDTIARITAKHKHKIGGLLYDEDEDDMSDLSDLINNLSDMDGTHSGHSDLGDHEEMDQKEVENVLSYIDLFSPSTDAYDDEEDVVITPCAKQSKSRKKKKKKVKLSRSVSTKECTSSRVTATKKKKKKKEICVKCDMECKTNGKRMYSHTPETKRMKNVCKKDTKFAFCTGDIKYRHVLTKKRSRRHATPNVSIPVLIGKHNLNSLFTSNSDDDEGKEDNADAHWNAALTPLASDNVHFE